MNISKFWVQYADESTALELNNILRALNAKPLVAYTRDITKGLLAAAPYTEANSTPMYRVRILNILPKDMLEVSIY